MLEQALRRFDTMHSRYLATAGELTSLEAEFVATLERLRSRPDYNRRIRLRELAGLQGLRASITLHMADVERRRIDDLTEAAVAAFSMD
jgi:hypothetical protein